MCNVLIQEKAQDMTPEMKNEWLSALRSGDYEKGKDRLCVNDKFCCLGVLAEINGDLSSRVNKFGECYLLNSGKNVCGFGDLSSGKFVARGLYGVSSKKQADLVYINDNNATFEEVIEYIKNNL